jgi:hypothetical protein
MFTGSGAEEACDCIPLTAQCPTGCQCSALCIVPTTGANCENKTTPTCAGSDLSCPDGCEAESIV